VGPRPVGVLLALALCRAWVAAADQPNASGGDHPRIIYVDDRDPATVIAAAPAHSIVICDRNRQVTLSEPVRIRRPLTLRGLNARLPEKLGKTPLVVVEAEGVVVTDFELHGNGDTVSQADRAPLLVLEAGGFCVERGSFSNSSKDGILIDGAAAGRAGADLAGGVVRDIVGRVIRRDLVSVGGGGQEGHRIRNVLIDNVR
jgi:nitrous oxidase accessory protein NosD